MRERDIRQAAIDLIAATGEFHVVSPGKSDPHENPASSLKLCTIDPQSTQEDDRWDGDLKPRTSIPFATLKPSVQNKIASPLC